MEVQLRPGISGFIYWPLAFMSLGLIPLLMRWAERRFIRQMDDTGVLTRGGTRISWNEFKTIERWQTKMSTYGNPLSDEYLLKSPKGKVSLPLWRTKNATEAREYLIGHLPPSVLKGNS